MLSRRRGLFEIQVAARGLVPRVAIDSAGITRAHLGMTPDPRVVNTVASLGADIAGNRARRITSADIALHDYIIALERTVYEHLVALSPDRAARVHSLRSLESEADDLDVPDPGEASDQMYARTFNTVGRATDRLLDQITLGGIHDPGK